MEWVLKALLHLAEPTLFYKAVVALYYNLEFFCPDFLFYKS